MSARNWKIASVSAAYVFAFFFVVWIKINVVRSGYRLQELDGQKKQAGLALSELETAWGKTVSLEKVTEQAQRKGFLTSSQYPLERLRHVDAKGAVTALPLNFKSKTK